MAADTKPAAEAKPVATAVHTVTAPLVTVRVGDKVVYLDRGSVVPAGAEPDSVKHLLSVGLIK